jgi:hypothetical protein
VRMVWMREKGLDSTWEAHGTQTSARARQQQSSAHHERSAACAKVEQSPTSSTHIEAQKHTEKRGESACLTAGTRGALAQNARLMQASHSATPTPTKKSHKEKRTGGRSRGLVDNVGLWLGRTKEEKRFFLDDLFFRLAPVRWACMPLGPEWQHCVVRGGLWGGSPLG